MVLHFSFSSSFLLVSNFLIFAVKIKSIVINISFQICINLNPGVNKVLDRDVNKILPQRMHKNAYSFRF